MKKLIIQPLIIIGVIVLLSYYVNILNNATSKVVNRNIDVIHPDNGGLKENAESVIDYDHTYESLYSEPLDVYYYALKDFDKENHYHLWSADWFIYSIESKIKYTKEGILFEIGYGFMDLNEDGIDELIIADISQKSNSSQNIYLICTMFNNSPYVVMDVNGVSDTLIYDADSKIAMIDNTQNALFPQENNTIILKPFQEYKPNMPDKYYIDANYILLGKEYSSWQEAYLDYLYKLKGNSLDSYTFSLIYVDDNEIPELVCDSGVQATGCYILSYFNGMATALCTDRELFSYLEREGMICNSEGHSGYYFDHVFELIDARWIGVFIGDKYRRNEISTNADYFYDLAYFIDSKEVKEQEYLYMLNRIYDDSESKEPEVCVNIDEIIEILEELNS